MISNFKTYASVYNMNWVGSITALAKTPGEVTQDKHLIRRLNRFAKRIAQ